MTTAYINAIETANPVHKVSAEDTFNFIQKKLNPNKEEQRWIEAAIKLSGIKNRYSCIEDFTSDKARLFNGSKFPDTKSRNQVFQEEAFNLAAKGIEKLDFDPESITDIISISCTGLMAPGLEISLANHFHLNQSVNRHGINYMGCYAALHGLRLASSIVSNNPDAQVLLVAVELSTLHYQNSKEREAILSNLLFGDGAVTLKISGRKSPKSLSINDYNSLLLSNGKEMMKWSVGNLGFEMELSSKVPGLLVENSELLKQKLPEADFLAIHPGGKKIIENIASIFNADETSKQAAFQVLSHYGNMSSPSIIFVLKELLEGNLQNDRKILGLAFGPGISVESVLMKYHA